MGEENQCHWHPIIDCGLIISNDGVFPHWKESVRCKMVADEGHKYCPKHELENLIRIRERGATE